MRVLYYVPMIHTQQELGSLAGKVRETHERIYGEKHMGEFHKAIGKYWLEVEERINTAGLYQGETASQLHIFVDGLPNTYEAIVQRIVQELIALDIPAYAIIKKLQERGAKVHGTEDGQLLLKEYQYWTDISQGKAQTNPLLAKELLKARDRAIAKRVVEVLREGGVGLLFVGRYHDVVGELHKLPERFRIIYL